MPLIDTFTWRDESELITIPDTSDPSITYFGQAVAGSWTTEGKASSIWKIWAIDSSGRKLFANGEHRPILIWDNRAGYDYK